MPRLVLVILLAALALPAVAAGHAERATYYPDRDAARVPKRARSGPSRVVCKSGLGEAHQAQLARQAEAGTRRASCGCGCSKRCRYRHIQQAVDAAKSGDRILIMPGVYREEPSREIPVNDPKCAGDEYWESSGDQHQADGRVPTYLHQVDCPNSRNLIAIIGDSLEDEDRECDHKCNLQIEGMGRRARDVADRGRPPASPTSCAPTAPTASSCAT